MNNNECRASDLQLLGYTQKWLDYGVLTPERLRSDLERFREPDGDESTEHYRFALFYEYLDSRERMSDAEINHILELAMEDPDGTMAHCAVMQLIQLDVLSDTQFHKLPSRPAFKHFDTSKTYTRHKLLRLIRREGPTEPVLSRCLAEGDGEVHRYLLDHCGLPEEFLEELADKGGNRKVRNLAWEKLGRGKRPRKKD